ncbi:MAG: chromate transporter [Fusobacterium sp.]|nr:chromate transporter [Fusobacterium sp.]
MILWDLFWNFFNIGVFSFGGGYATLPFLYNISEVYNWYTFDDLSNMIAISSITPGPIGINMATFAGFKTSGLIGSLVSTTAIALPSLIFVVLISKALRKFSENIYVKSIIYVLKPLGCGLLSAVGVNMFVNNFLGENINLYNIAFLALLILISLHKKLNPLFYLGVAAIYGLIAGFLPQLF